MDQLIRFEDKAFEHMKNKFDAQKMSAGRMPMTIDTKRLRKILDRLDRKLPK